MENLTDCAIRQLSETVYNISNELASPVIAQSWSDRLKMEISFLSVLPSRYPLPADEPRHTKEIRRMPVGNFLVCCWVDEAAQTVWAAAIIYGKRDQLSALGRNASAVIGEEKVILTYSLTQIF